MAAPAVPDGSESDDAVRDLLTRRVDALATGDTSAWLATLAPQFASDRGDEIERLRTLRRLPVSDVALTLEASVRRRGHYSARVRMSYRLGSAPPAEHRDDIEVVLTPEGWRFGGSRPVVAIGDGGTVPPWYLPGVTTVQTPAGEVVLVWRGTRGFGGDVARLTTIGAEASRAAVPGGDSSGAAIVAVPDTAAVYQALVPGTGEADSGFAAVTADVPGPGGGDIVVVNPDVWPGLAAQEQQVVLTHELVHVAVGAAVGGGQPLWLAEGHADHVALRPVLRSGVTRRELAAPVFDSIGAPPGLPGAEDFTADAATAYPAAWLVVDYLARTYGEPAVLELLARLADTGQGADAVQAEDRALREVVGLRRTQLVRQWQADLAELAAEPGVRSPDAAVGAPG